MSDPASITLLLCPFCGGGNLHIQDAKFPLFVKCSCTGRGPLANDSEQAIAAWNTRVALAQPTRAQAGVVELVAQWRAEIAECEMLLRRYSGASNLWAGEMQGRIKALKGCANTLATLNGGG